MSVTWCSRPDLGKVSFCISDVGHEIQSAFGTYSKGCSSGSAKSAVLLIGSSPCSVPHVISRSPACTETQMYWSTTTGVAIYSLCPLR